MRDSSRLLTVLGGVPGWARALGAPANARAVIDFVNQRYWRAAYTFSRASVALAEDNLGVYSSYGVDAARIRDKGLKLEAAGTNTIRNSTFQGVVLGTPGTLPANVTVTSLAGCAYQVVGTGVAGGLDDFDLRIYGTATGGGPVNISFEAAAQNPSVPGDSWSEGLSLALVGGTLNNINSVYQRLSWSGAGVTPGTNTKPSLSGTLQRFSLSATAPASTTAVQPQLSISLISGMVIDATLRIGVPGLEKTAAPSSPIRTTGAVATRAVDALTLKPQAAGPYSWTFKFDDGSTQAMGSITGDYAVPPANLNRSDLRAAWAA